MRGLKKNPSIQSMGLVCILLALMVSATYADPILPGCWPLEFGYTGGPMVTSQFGPRARGTNDHYDFHGGVDFIGNAYATPGDIVYSVSDGMVMGFEDKGDEGWAVITWHYDFSYPDDYRGIYAHLYDVTFYNSVGDGLSAGFSYMGTTYDMNGIGQLHYASSCEPPDYFDINVANWHPSATLPIDDATCSLLSDVQTTTSNGYITGITFTASTVTEESDLEGLFIYIWYSMSATRSAKIQYSYSWHEAYAWGYDISGWEEYCTEYNMYFDEHLYQSYHDDIFLEDYPFVGDQVTVRVTPKDLVRTVSSGVPVPYRDTLEFAVTFPGWYVEEGYVGIELVDANPYYPCSSDPSQMRWGNLDGGPSMIVSDFSAQPADSGVTIQWTAIDAKSVEGINLLRSTDSTGTYERITATTLPCEAGPHTLVDFPGSSDLTYYYKYEIVYLGGTTVVSPECCSVHLSTLPSRFVLHQNYPNPFNPVTTIAFELSPREAGRTTLDIYNATGQLVKNLVSAELSAGEYNVTWDGTDTQNDEVASGVYFYKLSANGTAEHRKMLLLK